MTPPMVSDAKEAIEAREALAEWDGLDRRFGGDAMTRWLWINRSMLIEALRRVAEPSPEIAPVVEDALRQAAARFREYEASCRELAPLEADPSTMAAYTEQEDRHRDMAERLEDALAAFPLEKEVRKLFEIARPCFHYAERDTPDGQGFEPSETGRLLMNACRNIAQRGIEIGEGKKP